jgi:hypothetical protein
MKAEDEQHAEELGKFREAKVSGDLFFVWWWIDCFPPDSVAI